MSNDKFRILSLGHGLGHLDIYTCIHLQDSQKNTPNVHRSSNKLREGLRKFLSDEKYATAEYFLDIYLHPEIMKKFSKAILKEYNGEEFEIIGIESKVEDSRELPKLAKKMGCTINSICAYFDEYDFGDSKYDIILGGHVFYLHIYYPFMREGSKFMEKMFELAPVMVFLEYKHEIKPKEKAIENTIDYYSDGKLKVTFDHVKSYNSCVVKIKRT
jgi:hypothetical protein